MSISEDSSCPSVQARGVSTVKHAPKKRRLDGHWAVNLSDSEPDDDGDSDDDFDERTRKVALKRGDSEEKGKMLETEEKREKQEEEEEEEGFATGECGVGNDDDDGANREERTENLVKDGEDVGIEILESVEAEPTGGLPAPASRAAPVAPFEPPESHDGTKLWVLKCRLGSELDTVLHLTRKSLNSGRDYRVASILLPEGMKGWILIEAEQVEHVRELVEDVKSLAYGNETIAEESRSEMERIVRSRVGARGGLRPGQFVRVARGRYKNDLAEVVRYDEVAHSASVRLLPRIDYDRTRGTKRTPVAERAGSRAPFRRLPPGAFDPGALTKGGGRVVNRGEFLLFEGNRYKDGFLHADFPCDSLVAEGVRPSEFELDKFNRAVPASLNFRAGEKVAVTRGRRSGMTGRIVRSDPLSELFTVRSGEVDEPMTFKLEDLKRHFVAGDHVKVVEGEFKDESGLVIAVDGDVVVFVSDVGTKEVKVTAKCVVESDEVPLSGPPKVAGKRTGSHGVRVQGPANRVPKSPRRVGEGRFQGNARDKRGYSRGAGPKAQRLTNELVRVVKGPHKGLVGTVKGVTGGLAKFLLQTNGKFMSIDVGLLMALDKSGTPAPVQPKGATAARHRPRAVG